MAESDGFSLSDPFLRLSTQVACLKSRIFIMPQRSEIRFLSSACWELSCQCHRHMVTVNANKLRQSGFLCFNFGLLISAQRGCYRDGMFWTFYHSLFPGHQLVMWTLPATQDYPQNARLKYQFSMSIPAVSRTPVSFHIQLENGRLDAMDWFDIHRSCCVPDPVPTNSK